MRTALAERERMLDGAEGIVALDRDFRCTYLNRRAEEIEGWGARLRGQVIWEAAPGLGGSALERACREAVERRAPGVCKLQHRQWARCYEARLVPREGGGLYVYLRDVTELREAGEARARAEAERDAVLRRIETESRLLRAVIEHAPAGIVLYRGRNYVVQLLNSAWQGFAPGIPMLGRPAFEIWPELAPLRTVYDRLLDTGEIYVMHEQPMAIRRRLDGPVEAALFSAVHVPMRLPDGGEALLVTAVEDTKQVQARRQLEALAEERAALLARAEEALRARDVFLSVAAHELRTPLTALRLQVDHMRRILASGRELTPDTAVAKTAILGRQVTRLERLADSLVDAARLAGGQMELRPEPMDLRDVTETVVAEARAEAAQADQTVELCAPQPVPGLWDPRRVRQIVGHLLANALRHRAGKVVEVAVGGSAAAATLVVRDHGDGIAAADQQRIFRLFERATSELHHGGLGLGLWFVSRLVSAMGGSVALESAPGAGSAFTVTLPRGARS